MLAIASLHIAKLQDGPVTPSLKHYAISLRRVGKLINIPERQKQPATLAAAMLLAFYECWCADHQKWSNHILGARQLLRFTDFPGISKYIKQTRRQREQEQMVHYQQQQHYGNNTYNPRFPPQADMGEVDEDVVARLAGTSHQHRGKGRVMDDSPPEEPSHYTQKELDDYYLQRDLYWWYCKQDVYQSILGGGKLL